MFLHEEKVEEQILEKELEVAQQTQVSLLLRALPQVARWEFATLCQVAHPLRGDFYDPTELPGEPEPLGVG